MAIFQKSVIKKHLNNLDKEQVEKAFLKFRENYTPAKIEHIKKLKEEEYQDGFLREIFVDVLGYTLRPSENFDLQREFKNQTDGKKADGAILKNENAIAVIELKSAKTKDLTLVTQQAFNYKNNQPECKYVITSNFQKLRFYIDYSNEYEEFDLFHLDKEEFELLFLILSKDSIFSNLPLKLKEETQFHDQNISAKLYKDYSNFKRKLYDNLTFNHPEIDKLSLFKKSQKLLDRFLFILFAEDSGLLPPNSISRIIKRFEILKEEDSYKPLYEIFKQYFGYMNAGRKGKKQEDDIPAYNGGLFYEDELLDILKIDDELLILELRNLSEYDFNTEVDVNILGHIFEHSLNEIEEVSAEIQGTITDNSRSKRKKDGVFYTPKYITQYIVENTIGTLCNEKRKELQIEEIEFDGTYQAKNGKLSEKGKNLYQKLTNYKDWLINLKIIDPACGSGAFLNQALNFLIAEHTTIDDIIAELTNSPLRLFDVDKNILENNLFGVDINEESVEIAQLSLWLRTARKDRKLSSLNNNIKCGNSLLTENFDWHKEFPDIMKNGGFDVVIGNPPYVDIKSLDPEFVKGLFKYYKTAENRINLYSIFIEKAYELVKPNGFVSFINPNSILVNSSYKKIRALLIDEMTKIIKLPDDVFIDAKVETIIFELRKNNKNKFVDVLVYPKSEKIDFVDNSRIKRIEKAVWKKDENLNYNIFLSPDGINLLNKIKQNSTNELGEISDFSLGITPYDKYQGHSQEIIKSRAFHANEKLDSTYKPLIAGENILRFNVTNQIREYIKYGDWLGAKREERFFTSPRIIVRQIVSGKPPRIYAGFTDEALYFTQIGFSIIPEKAESAKYLLTIINSKLITYYHKYKFLDIEKDLFQKILIANCKQLPIVITTKEHQQPFIEKADKMLDLNQQLQEKSKRFIKRVNDNFELEKISKKLETFYENDFKSFVSELNKQKVVLSLIQQDEWEAYFTSYKTEINQIQTEINKTDNEIDKMVYNLYDLTESEISEIENAIK
ncbi:MAG: restriction endonuclease subunit M [Bacteroidetes bacterium HGW-Bacteroidetes-3]|jgi:type I restriction-modification system DNA methylase subunit|nr:MAG: restriction endonuclease subunit M [Bacteroidetes bacterium HGW-Bacteroidetes-3]